MEDLLPSLIVVALTGVGVAGLFLYLAWRRKQQAALLQQAAQEHGWQMERLQQGNSTGFKLSGKSAGVAWSLESLAASQDSAPGSSPVSRSTRWWSEDARLPERAVVVGPNAALGASGLKGLNNPLLQSSLMQFGLSAMLGEDAAWVSRLSPAPVGSPALTQRFGVLAHDSHDARRLLDAPADARLAALPAALNPVVKLREIGLEISLRDQQVSDPRELEALINLGISLVRAWQANS
jgi:hypothetical protein